MVSTAKNTFYLLIAYVYQKLVALLYFIFLARFLGADNFGKYTFALSFAALFSVLIDFGLLPVLTREVARNKEKTQEYFSSILGFCLLAGIIIFAFSALIINLMGYPPVTSYLVYLTTLVILLDTLALVFYFIFRGHLNTKYEALGIVIHKTVMLIVGLFLIHLKVNLLLMVLPLLMASIFYLTNAVFFVKKKLKLKLIPKLDQKILKPLLKISWPFFIAACFAKLYSTSDTILLSYLAGDKAVGLYSAALKLINAFLLLIAGSLSSALYPALSYYFIRSKEEMVKLFSQAVLYLMIIVIPLVLGLLILSKQIILFIYGPEYAPAILILIILSLSIPFMFLDFIFVSLFNACEKQKKNTLIHGLGTIIFIVLNLILIPILGYYGSALAVFFGFIIIFCLEIFYTRKIIKIDKNHLFKKIGLIFFSSLIMALIIFLIKEKIHLIFSCLIGILVYFVAVYSFNLVKKKDLDFIKEIINFRSIFIKTESKENKL